MFENLPTKNIEPPYKSGEIPIAIYENDGVTIPFYTYASVMYYLRKIFKFYTCNDSTVISTTTNQDIRFVGTNVPMSFIYELVSESKLTRNGTVYVSLHRCFYFSSEIEFTCPFIQNHKLVHSFREVLYKLTEYCLELSQEEKCDLLVYSTFEFDEHYLNVKHTSCSMCQNTLAYFIFPNTDSITIFERVQKCLLKHGVNCYPTKQSNLCVSIDNMIFMIYISDSIFIFNETLDLEIGLMYTTLYWNFFKYQFVNKPREYWRRSCFYTISFEQDYYNFQLYFFLLGKRVLHEYPKMLPVNENFYGNQIVANGIDSDKIVNFLQCFLNNVKHIEAGDCKPYTLQDLLYTREEMIPFLE